MTMTMTMVLMIPVFLIALALVLMMALALVLVLLTARTLHSTPPHVASKRPIHWTKGPGCISPVVQVGVAVADGRGRCWGV